MAVVSHQVPYHHFPTRGHLLAAIAAQGFDQLAEELESIQQGGTSPAAMAQDTGVRYVTFAAENPERFRLMFGSERGSREPYPELDESARRVFTLLVRPFGLTANEKRGADPSCLPYSRPCMGSRRSPSTVRLRSRTRSWRPRHGRRRSGCGWECGKRCRALWNDPLKFGSGAMFSEEPFCEHRYGRRESGGRRWDGAPMARSAVAAGYLSSLRIVVPT